MRIKPFYVFFNYNALTSQSSFALSLQVCTLAIIICGVSIFCVHLHAMNKYKMIFGVKCHTKIKYIIANGCATRSGYKQLAAIELGRLFACAIRFNTKL